MITAKGKCDVLDITEVMHEYVKAFQEDMYAGADTFKKLENQGLIQIKSGMRAIAVLHTWWRRAVQIAAEVREKEDYLLE